MNKALFDIGGVSVQRYGGNHSSLYNWLVDSGNAGSDNYFSGGSGKLPAQVVPGAIIDDMVTFDISKSAKSVITVPLTGWVNKFSRGIALTRKAFIRSRTPSPPG